MVPWVPQAHSSHVSLRIRWWWNDGSGSTHQSSRATRASGKAWMLEQWQLGSCWWLLVTMPSWNSKGKRGLLSLNPPNLFFMWKFILGGLVCDTFGRVFIPCPSCEAFFYNWGLLWPWWVDFWEPIEFSVWFHGRFAPQNEPTKIFELQGCWFPNWKSLGFGLGVGNVVVSCVQSLHQVPMGSHVSQRGRLKYCSCCWNLCLNHVVIKPCSKEWYVLPCSKACKPIWIFENPAKSRLTLSIAMANSELGGFNKKLSSDLPG